MSFLKLSWCQLIKIVLSQIGGNPLQQIYTQLNQGLPTMGPGGILPQGLAEIKGVIDGITAAVQAAQAAANDFTNVLDNIANQLYQNPVGTVIEGTYLAANARIATLNVQLAEAKEDGPFPNAELAAALTAEISTITNYRENLVTFKNNTDRLSGVGSSISGGKGSQSCSLQDLLGSGCTPNDSVPDIDIKELIESLKQGDAIAAIKEKLENATGVSDLKQEVANFSTTISGFNASFAAKLDKAAIKNAVSSQITQIAYNLLSGCGNEVLNLTLKGGIKSALEPYVEALELQRTGEAYYDLNGELVDQNSLPQETTVAAAIDPPVQVDVGIATREPQKYYIDGIEVTKEQYDREQSLWKRQLEQNKKSGPDLKTKKGELEIRINSLNNQIADLRREEQRLLEEGKTATGENAGRIATTIQRIRNTIISKEITLGDTRRELSNVILQIERNT